MLILGRWQLDRFYLFNGGQVMPIGAGHPGDNSLTFLLFNGGFQVVSTRAIWVDGGSTFSISSIRWTGDTHSCTCILGPGSSTFSTSSVDIKEVVEGITFLITIGEGKDNTVEEDKVQAGYHSKDNNVEISRYFGKDLFK